MPTVMRIGSFFSGDRDEPMHIHIERDAAFAKFWLVPVRLQHSIGFGRAGLVKVENLIVEHRETIMEAWNSWHYLKRKSTRCCTNQHTSFPQKNRGELSSLPLQGEG